MNLSLDNEGIDQGDEWLWHELRQMMWNIKKECYRRGRVHRHSLLKELQNKGKHFTNPDLDS